MRKLLRGRGKYLMVRTYRGYDLRIIAARLRLMPVFNQLFEDTYRQLTFAELWDSGDLIQGALVCLAREASSQPGLEPTKHLVKKALREYAYHHNIPVVSFTRRTPL